MITEERLALIRANEARINAVPNEVRLTYHGHYRQEPAEPIALEVGQRVKLSRDGRKWWTVRGVTEHTVVLTRQAEFRAKGVLTYTVIDWRAGVRGPVNTIGQGWDVDTAEDCQELAELVADGDWSISHRNWVPIDVIVNG